MKRFAIVSAPIALIFVLTTHGISQRLSLLQSEMIYEKAPFPQCHASTIEETPDGLVAAWFGGTREKDPDVEIWLSRYVAGKWSVPVSVANGIQYKGKRYPCWNPVLFKYPEGPLVLFYKVGKNPREWWGEMKTSTDNGLTWSEAKRLPEDILGPIKNKPILLKDGRLICPTSSEHDGWRVHFEITSDKGKTWERLGPIGSSNHFEIIQPSILQYENGDLQILCRSRNQVVVESWSKDGGSSWSEPKATTLPNPNSGTDAVTLNNGWQMIIYNDSYDKSGNNRSGERTPLNLAVSKDGKIWEMVYTLESIPGEYSYPAIIQGKDDSIHITYTYNREKIKYVKMKWNN